MAFTPAFVEILYYPGPKFCQVFGWEFSGFSKKTLFQLYKPRQKKYTHP